MAEISKATQKTTVELKTKLELVNSSSPRLKEIWGIYENSFPADERRDLNKEIEFLKEKKFNLYAIITEEGKTARFAVIWKFDNFFFANILQ